MEQRRNRNEPDPCGKVTLTQRHRTDEELCLVKICSEASAVWHTPTCSDTQTHTQTHTHTHTHTHTECRTGI